MLTGWPQLVGSMSRNFVDERHKAWPRKVPENEHNKLDSPLLFSCLLISHTGSRNMTKQAHLFVEVSHHGPEKWPLMASRH